MRILLVDDHVSTRHEIRALLERDKNYSIVGEASSGEDAIALVRRVHPDMVLMDIVMPGITGIEATSIIVKESPSVKVLALSNHSGHSLVQAIVQAGGMGYVRKDRTFEELLPAIRTVSEGKRFLGQYVDE